jgi:hypothetical protein
MMEMLRKRFTGNYSSQTMVYRRLWEDSKTVRIKKGVYEKYD